jgi:hypothetical protein
VDGQTWNTSIWRDKRGRSMLPVPRHIRGEKGDGDVVAVTIVYELDD